MGNQLDWMTLATVAGPLIGVAFGSWLTHYIESQPRLVSYISHSAAIMTPSQSVGSPPLVVHTHSVVVKNTSRRLAANIRVGHKILPAYSIYPSTQCSVVAMQDGTSEIVIPQLVSSEQITISYLYFPPVTYGEVNTYVKSDEGFAKILPVQLVAPTSPFIKFISSALMIVGAASIGYLMIRLV